MLFIGLWMIFLNCYLQWCNELFCTAVWNEWLWVLDSHQERCTQDRRPRPMVFAKVFRYQMVPSRAKWRGEADNRATTPVGYCPSTESFCVRPYCKNATRDRCQEYHNCFPFGELGEPPGRPRTTWMKTIQQDLRSNNLSPDEAITVAQNLMSAFGATHP